MADITRAGNVTKLDGFESAQSSHTEQSIESIGKKLQNTSLSVESMPAPSQELSGLVQPTAGPPVQLIPATPRTPASPPTTLKQSCAFPSSNTNESTTSFSLSIDCSKRSSTHQHDDLKKSIVGSDLPNELMHAGSTPIESSMNNQTGDDETPRARRLWESGRRSLAKIIATVASSSQSQAARRSSNSEVGADEISATIAGSSSCIYHNTDASNPVIPSSAETSRVSSCDLEMTAVRLGQNRQQNTQVSLLIYSTYSTLCSSS